MSRIEEVVDQQSVIEKPITEENSGNDELNLCHICSDGEKREQKMGTAGNIQLESQEMNLPPMQIDGFLLPEAWRRIDQWRSPKENGEGCLVLPPDPPIKKGGLKEGEAGFVSRPDQPGNEGNQSDRATIAPPAHREAVPRSGRESGSSPKEANGAQTGDVMEDGKPVSTPRSKTDTSDIPCQTHESSKPVPGEKSPASLSKEERIEVDCNSLPVIRPFPDFTLDPRRQLEESTLDKDTRAYLEEKYKDAWWNLSQEELGKLRFPNTTKGGGETRSVSQLSSSKSADSDSFIRSNYGKDALNAVRLFRNRAGEKGEKK